MVSYALLPWFLTIFFLVIVTVLWHLCSVSAFVFVDGFLPMWHLLVSP